MFPLRGVQPCPFRACVAGEKQGQGPGPHPVLSAFPQLPAFTLGSHNVSGQGAGFLLWA